MNLLYSLIKDLIGLLKLKEETKLVEQNYPEKIGISDQSLWCNPHKLERRLSNGYHLL